jgi:hypothetical protein
MTRMLRSAFLLFLAAASCLAQQPLGGPFRVSTDTSSRDPAIAYDGSGGFVVAWNEDVNGTDVFARRFAPDATPLSDAFRVNASTTGGQLVPSVGVGLLGDFVIVWEDNAADGSSYAVMGQRYAAAGAPLGPPFRVNSHTTGGQFTPSVAVEPAGGFVVVWWDFPAGAAGGYGVFGQRYAASGAPLGPEFQVSATTSLLQTNPNVAMDGAANFVVAWGAASLPGFDSELNVFARRYAAGGAPLGDEFRVNTTTTGQQQHPSIAMAKDGDFVVVWQSNQSLSQYDAFGRRFDAAGNALGAEFRVNASTSGKQDRPVAARLPGGGFVVSWGAVFEIRARFFDRSGTPYGSEFRVNGSTSAASSYATVASSNATFTVVWATSTGLFAQRYAAARSAGDADGNGTVDVLDVFYLINFLFAGGPSPVARPGLEEAGVR